MNTTDLSMFRGDTGDFQATFTDNATPPNLINDPGAVFRMTVKRFTADPDSAEIVSVTASQSGPGVAFLSIPPAAFAGLVCPAFLVYDIQVTETGGRVSTIAKGRFTVLDDVSQTTP